MYTLCVTEKTALQQRTFEAAFLALALEVPYDDITISELCRRAGLSRKIFYRLFERKADVLIALLDHTILDGQSYQPEASESGGLHSFLAFWRDKKDLLDILEMNRNGNLLTDRVIHYILQEDSGFRRCFGLEHHGQEALVFYISGIFSVVLEWHKRGFDKHIDELAEALMYLLTTPPVKYPLVGKSFGADGK